MAVTTLDPKSALIVIDLQKGIMAAPTVHPIGEVIQRTATLVDAFRQNGMPIVFVVVTGVSPGRTEQRRSGGGSHSADWAEIVPELKVQSEDFTVKKQTWGAFTDTGLGDHLKTLGVTQVVLTGIATSIGVESTARQAYESGRHVTLATDAMTDINADAHINSLTRIFPKLGETGTTEEILALLSLGSRN
jgi:nicotinamidase-related amidase